MLRILILSVLLGGALGAGEAPAPAAPATLTGTEMTATLTNLMKVIQPGLSDEQAAQALPQRERTALCGAYLYLDAEAELKTLRARAALRLAVLQAAKAKLPLLLDHLQRQGVDRLDLRQAVLLDRLLHRVDVELGQALSGTP